MKKIMVSDRDLRTYIELLELKRRSEENIKGMEKILARMEELKIIHADEIAAKKIAEDAKKSHK